MTTLERLIDLLEHDAANNKDELVIKGIKYSIQTAKNLLDKEKFQLDRQFDEGWISCLKNQNQ
jgi:hypothetical protein